MADPANAQDPERWQPFEPRAYRLVNSVAFLPDDRAMIVALFTRQVFAHRGQRDTASAPELGLFLAQREGTGWSEPELLSVSGRFADYEPALAPDGSLLVFNSKRPWPDGRVPTRNDLWFAERTGSSWGTPRPIDGINSFDLEESYPTITRDRSLLFVRGPTREGTDEFDLYETQMMPNGSFSPAARVSVSTDRFGEGDPWVHPDREYLIFTRWDPAAGWQQTCDLYIAFRAGPGWTVPVPLTEINTPAPDYAAAVSPDGEWLYYRAGGPFLRRPLAPLLQAARARSSQ
jgi:hypothetical protein